MAWTSRLPDADVLDRVACRAAALAFPICTVPCDRRRDLGGGRAGRYYWAGGQRDDGLRRLDGARLLPARRVRPRLARAVAAVQRDRVAVMVFNLFFVNLVATGLRSYAGVG